MKYSAILLTVLFLFTACQPDPYDPNKAAFVTYLGEDTLAVEEFEKTENGLEARVILRSPETVFSEYDVTLDDNGGIVEMERSIYSLEDGFTGQPAIVQTVRTIADSLRVEYMTDNGSRVFMIAHEEGVLPFIDMVHWPYELVLNRASEMGQDTLMQPLLSGSRISDFVIADMGQDSMTIRHPSRGVMGVRVNEAGDLMFLDAGLTTRKLKVYRVPSVDMLKIGRDFAASDKEGSPFGQLSSAEAETFSFKDTEFRVEYGSPKKRGRDLFGGIVPWGKRWRTGANRATHFYTSSDLMIGDLEVPAGEYTLFTIPEEDGGIMMINTQTGQNGQTYNEDLDLGRVPMSINNKEDSTEDFTIRVEETDTGGAIRLIWGQTVFSVDFTIR
ncbi:DUF2911 domain-containing protein [Balneola sp. MJW-20]|uniref:DUF2911 domain-containing protein n=1 Tax=Gracilimonas aurantiaca TaxID=3234185 RepID=UPI003466EF5D